MHENELYHHGILGQKWGKKNGPPYPLKVSKHSASEKKAGWKRSLSNSKISNNTSKDYSNIVKYKDFEFDKSKEYQRYPDVQVPEGHTFERVYTEKDNYDKDSYKNKRLYVSDNASGYLNDYFISDLSKIKIQTLKTNKNLTFAGEKTVDDILKEIGEEPLKNVFDENGSYNMKSNGTDRDFLMNNVEIGEKFIKKALEKGYGGVRDPVDDMGIAFDQSAKIIFDKKGYKTVGIKPVRF